MKKKLKQTEPKVSDEQRRELLLKLGKVAIYTPPALLTLMVSRRASADSLGGPPPP